MNRATVPGAALAALILAGCGDAPVERTWACASLDDPPTVLDTTACPADRTVVGNGARWYSAPSSDIGPDDTPIVGAELDGDFYDLADQLDLDDRGSVSTTPRVAPSTPKATPKTTPTKSRTRPTR